MRKIKNVEEFVPYKDELMFVGIEGQRRTLEVEINAIGPCVVWLKQLKGEKQVTKHLLGCHEGLETYQVDVEAHTVAIEIEEGTPWVRVVRGKVAAPNPSEGETFTRMEKLGLHVDELGVALHRQSILQGIASQRENLERDNYQRSLERRLGELTTLIDKLKPKEEGEPKAEAPKAEAAKKEDAK